MRSSFLPYALLLCAPALAAGASTDRACAVKLNSTLDMVAPPGWRFSECTSEARGDKPNFTLVRAIPAAAEPGAVDVSAVTIYGRPLGRGTVESFLSNEREFLEREFESRNGDGLRTADDLDLRVLELTRREGAFLWMARAYLRLGPAAYVLIMECKQENLCANSYPAFKRLVSGLQVLTPNEHR